MATGSGDLGGVSGIETAPSSPPGLTRSKSSKSSSSSHLSSLEAAGSNDISHFEDITLADVSRDSLDENAVKAVRKPPAKRPLRPSPSAAGPQRSMPPPVQTLQPLPNGMKPRYPSLQGHVNGILREQSLNLPTTRMRRIATSPSSSSLSDIYPHGRPSRSPSPNMRMHSGYHASPRATPRQSTEISPLTQKPISRAQSWQPSRKKTVKELEAEYHDSDEELPEDAVIWNVPISPHPPPNRSTTPSPQRWPSIAAFPSDALSFKQRTKSWTHDLCPEALDITQKLEAFASHQSSERQDSGTTSATNSPPRPSSGKMRTKTSMKELPPLQRWDALIDPLPPSKEKEQVLSRTRPSWLPPKCQKEERKHLKEWERMMADAKIADRKRATKQLVEQQTKTETQTSNARIWEEHVLPDWDRVVKEPGTRELWWRGVTPRSRGTVWAKAIGNELELSEASYTAALGRAREMQASLSELDDGEGATAREAAWFSAIDRDVPTVFPDLRNTFSTPGPAQEALHDVLRAYIMYRSDVGYVYGLHLMAGLLVLHMDAAQAFIALANLLNRPIPLAFLVHDVGAMGRAYDLVLAVLEQKLPRLHEHLANEERGLGSRLRVQEWLEPLFRTLFAWRLDVEAVSRIWDVYVFEGDKVLVRAAVGLLARLEGRLYGDRDEVFGVLGWAAQSRLAAGDEEELVKAVREAGKVAEVGRGSEKERRRAGV
ncbi:hypothetical protein LTR50_001009 [Elasticomyces elasticus]|nr:hypothetical protein LTR50_001009 [Elasticomyces elasticus]